MNAIAWIWLPVADIFYAFGESTLPGKAIVLLLFAGSILAWSIMITKWIDLRRGYIASHRFLTSFRSQPHPIALYMQGQDYAASPLFVVYEEGCRELGRELNLPESGRSQLFGAGMGPDVRISAAQLEGVGSVADRHVADQALLLEQHMNVLATAVSAAPFLGLLGTVWGVMDGFGGMAREGAATLSAVAPGISAALLTTVVGLLVALPSAIGYNLLTNRIREMTVELDNFAQEFVSAVRRFYFTDVGR